MCWSRRWCAVEEMETGLVAALHGHQGMILQVKFNRADTFLASCAEDGTARLWDVAKALKGSKEGAVSCKACFFHSFSGMALSLAFIEGEALNEGLLTGGDDGIIRLWATKPAMEGPPCAGAKCEQTRRQCAAGTNTGERG